MELFASKRRVLVLDRNSRLSKFVNEITLDDGFDIHTSYNSSDLFDWAKMVKPDVILLDCIMLDNICEMICQELKEDDTLKNVPVVVIASSPSKKYVSNSFKCDALFISPKDMNETASQIFFGDIKNYFTYLMMKISNPYFSIS